MYSQNSIKLNPRNLHSAKCWCLKQTTESSVKGMLCYRIFAILTMLHLRKSVPTVQVPLEKTLIKIALILK